MSNRLTFSLASLIFLIALGLVFGTTSVMAHEVTDDNNGTGEVHEGDTPLGDTNHNAHPTVTSIVLKPGALVRDNMVVVTDDDATTADVNESQFTLVITFDREVVSAATILSAAADVVDPTADPVVDNVVLAVADFTENVTLANNASATGGVDIADATRVAGSNNQFEAVATLSTAFPTGNSGADAFRLRVSVNARAAFSPQTHPLNSLNPIPGGASEPSTVYAFTLVNMLPTLTPTVMIEAESGATVDAPFDVTFTFGPPAPSTFADTDITVTGGYVSAGPTQGTGANTNVWTATIDPGSTATEVTVSVAAAKATGTAASVTATTDTTPPMLTSTVGDADATTGARTVTLAFDEALTAMPTVSHSASAGIENTYTVSAVADDGDATTTNTYTVTVTPTAATTADIPMGTVTLTVSAMDASDNAITTGNTVPVMLAARTAPEGTLADGTFKIPAESYIIVGHGDGSMGLPTSLTPMGWDAMPDLENLLYTGGTIAVTMADADFDHDGDAATAMRKPADRDALITEVMWARNLAEVGQAGELSHQWIEVYNNLKVEVTVTISTKQGQPALGAGSGQKLVDRLSNVVGARWQLTGVGQNGYDDGDRSTASTNFISMYRKERGKDGQTKGHWAQSTETYLANHKGTPGAKERSQIGTVNPTEFNVGALIFNEISNRSDADKAYEWIEIRNKSGGEVNPKNWQISIVTAVNSDEVFFTFPNNDNAKIPAGGLLLLVKSDPSGEPDHPLAAGWNVAKNAANQVNGVNSSSPRYLVANFAGDGLPDSGEFVLILRNHNNKRGKAEHLIDIAGFDTNLKVSANEAGYTNLWPLKGGVRDAQLGNNKLEKDQVHRRQKDNIWGTSSTNYGRNGGNHHDDTAWRNEDWKGIGYKRNAAANNINGGTPGYPNNAIKSEGIAQGSQVIISEIMYDTSRNLPQWIELQNLSTSLGVNIDNWSIFVVNHNLALDGEDYTEGKLSERIDLDGRIPPGQTFLIVSTGNRQDTQLPSERIHNLRRGRGEKLLNPNGFRIQLKAKTHKGANEHQLVDDVGNLPDKPANSRRVDAQSFMDPVWTLPSGTNEDGDRVSIARLTTKDTDAQDRRIELRGLKENGVIEGGWIRSDEDNRLSRMHSSTYYGHASDIASPGQTVGSVLPVELSTFRPTRLDDGSVVIRWATESELNNAGFNILRSDTRDGQFTKLNTQLIAGQGTTSERTAYEWKDTTAKPNVVYYYQIQDVSIDGDIATLRTNRLRGHVSPTGKATTTWGQLKSLQ